MLFLKNLSKSLLLSILILHSSFVLSLLGFASDRQSNGNGSYTCTERKISPSGSDDNDLPPLVVIDRFVSEALNESAGVSGGYRLGSKQQTWTDWMYQTGKSIVRDAVTSAGSGVALVALCNPVAPAAAITAAAASIGTAVAAKIVASKVVSAVLPASVQEKYSTALSLGTSFISGFSAAGFGNILGTIGAVAGSNIGYGATTIAVNQYEEKNGPVNPWVKSAFQMAGSVAGGTLGSAFGSSIIQSMDSVRGISGANAAEESMMIETPEQRHARVCNATLTPPAEFDASSVELSNFKQAMFDDGNTTVRAVTFTHDRNSSSELLSWGNTKFTEQGKFVFPFVQITFGKGKLMRCANNETPLSHLVYADNADYFDAGVEENKLCSWGGGVGYAENLNYLGHGGASDIRTSNAETMTIEQLKNMFLIHPHVKNGCTDGYTNFPNIFLQNTKITGHNVNCNINTLKPHLLFCLAPNGDEAYYINGIDAFNSVIENHCSCEGATDTFIPEACRDTNSLLNPNTNSVADNSTDTQKSPETEPEKSSEAIGKLAAAIAIPITITAASISICSTAIYALYKWRQKNNANLKESVTIESTISHLEHCLSGTGDRTHTQVLKRLQRKIMK